MDAREFYGQIVKAYKELIDINRAFDGLRMRTEAFSCRLEELTRDATNIKDEEKSEKFMVVLSSLSERLHEFDEQWYNIGTFLDNVRYYDFIDLVDEAEEMANEEKKSR